MVSSINDVWKAGYPFIKTNIKWIKDIRLKAKAIKILNKKTCHEIWQPFLGSENQSAGNKREK